MYDFSQLSPIDFEELVRDLLQAKLNVRMESFRAGKDQGIDFRFATGGGSIIVQAKHYLRSGERALIATAKKENEKVRKLKPVRYILVTSLPMSNDLKEKIISALPDAPLADADIIGKEDLNAYLVSNPKIERAHFKLWLSSTAILEKIFNAGILNRTETELNLIKSLVPKFVQNKSVDEAEAILSKNGTLIISGDPGVGKTTLARILLSLHGAQGWELNVVSDMEEAFRVSTKGDKKLIFFDDFLGQVRLSDDHVRALDQRLPSFLARVKASENLRFILTTRELILNQARIISRNIDSRLLLGGKYLLDVGSYTRDIRARILYNHIYYSDLPSNQIASLLEGDQFLKVIDHGNFNPRLIDIVTRGDYQVLSGEPLKDVLFRVLANPEELWTRPYRDHISSDGRSLMLALLLNKSAVTIAELRLTFGRVSAALDGTFPTAQAQMRFQKSLLELEGAVLTIVSRRVRFSNPGVRDFLQVAIISDGLLLAIVEQIETFDEIKQAWEICRTQQSHASVEKSDPHNWSIALQKMLDSDSPYPLERLDLILEIYDVYNEDETILDLIHCAAEQLQNTQLDQSDISMVKNMLENITMHRVPIDVQLSLHDVITSSSCGLLSNGGSLSLEDIKELESALRSYGSDLQSVEDAIRAALDVFVRDLNDELYNLSSIDELNWLEEDFYEIGKRVAYTKTLPEHKLESRRDDLFNKESGAIGNKTYSSAIKTQSYKTEISDDSIRSMFVGINDLR